MKEFRWRQVSVLFAVAVTIAVNILANALPINGQTTGEISDSFDVFFVPAGYVFSIWGLIYLGLIAYAIYQLLPAQKENSNLMRISSPFIVSSLANIAWIFLWHYEMFALSVLVMTILLVSLILIYLRLDIGRMQVSTGMRWLVHLPFSIYLGWITVATIANVTALLAHWNWSGWGLSPEMWTVIMLTIAAIVGGLVSFTRGDIAYAAVLVWAFIGIAVKQSDSSTVSAAAWMATAATIILLIIGTYRHRRFLQRVQPAIERGSNG
ncbi:MAG: hypothetical protein R3293_24750 [Candidatus Promineifilaceae bacterium]|nr:hypothetical protein [Candidatus Promineifilaceae bacterium]